jgi:hypothetical protein
MKEAEEFAGSHVLSMVCAHYPLIDFMRFTKGYLKEVGDINMCGTPTPLSQGTPTMFALGSSSRPPGTAVSTSQSQVGQSSCGHDQPDTCGSSSISGGSATAVDRW